MSGGPLRSVLYASVAPSGDQTGAVSQAGSDCSRVGIPRSRSKSQMSPLPVRVSVTLTATREPSGEIRNGAVALALIIIGALLADGGPREPIAFPSRLNQEILETGCAVA